MDDYILEIPNFLSKDLCKSVVTRFENDSRKKHGYFSYPINGEIVQRDKQNTELMISDLEGWTDIQRIFTESVQRAFHVYMEHLRTNFNYDCSCHVYDRELSQPNFYFTTFPVQRIEKGCKYEWHHDGDFHRGYFVQALFYLNTLEEGEGGCTEFRNGRKVRPEAGKLLIYPCSWTFLHTGGEVLGGPKYICTSTLGFNPSP